MFVKDMPRFFCCLFPEQMTGLLERAKELRDGAAVTHKAKDDAPNYRHVGNASLQRCGTCRHFTDSGRCDLYSFKADAMYACDSWRPDIERLKKARVGAEGVTVKHLSHNQTTHGFRFGGVPSLEQARKYRKSGVMEQYAHRARQLSGKRSARDKNEEKRDKIEGDKSLDSAVRLGLVKDRAETVRIAKAAQRVQGGNWRTAVGRAIVAKSIENIRNRVEQGGERTEIYRKLLEELETTKEVSASPTAVYAHGPGGLFSPAGLGDTGANGRKRKKRKPARDGELFNAMITTKPGDKYRSIKNPKVYERLIAKGMSKSQAAAISNAMARRGKRKKKETAVTPLEYAIQLKHASHNQASHGFRFGATPSLEQARRYRKAGVLQDYTKRARTPERAGQRERGRLNREAADSLIESGVGVPRAGDFRGYLKRQGATLEGNKLTYQGRTMQYGAGKQKLDLTDTNTQRNIVGDMKRIGREGKQQTYGPHHKDRKVGEQLFKKGRYGKELNLVSWDGKLRVNAKIKDQMGVIALGVKRPGDKRYSGYRIMSSWDITEYLSQFREEAGKEYDPLAYAIALKHASHSQASHGFRFGKTPSLEQARRYRKAGVLQEYSKRSRERTGTKPARERNAEKWRGDISRDNNEIIKKAPSRTSRSFEYDNSKYAISLSNADADGNRSVTMWPKSGRMKGRGYEVGSVNVRTGKIRVGDASVFMSGSFSRNPSDSQYDAINQRFGIGAITAGLDAIIERDTNKEQKTQPPTFTVFKDKTGRYRWVAISSTAYRDRDGEIVSTKALADDVAHADATGEYGTLRWWHVPGLDLGDCDFNMLYGRSLIESGTFKNDRIAERVKEKAHLLKLSLGFRHPADEPDTSGVFHTIRRFERSLIPPEGNASNLFTRLVVT